MRYFKISHATIESDIAVYALKKKEALLLPYLKEDIVINCFRFSSFLICSESVVLKIHLFLSSSQSLNVKCFPQSIFHLIPNEITF